MNPLDFLSGYKTAIGGLASIGGGIYLMVAGETDKGFTLITMGMIALGIGGKLQANTDAVNRVAIVNAAMDPQAARVLQATADHTVAPMLKQASTTGVVPPPRPE